MWFSYSSPGPEVPERDPGRLAGPAAVDQLGLDREHPADGLDRPGGRRLPAGAKVEVTDLDPQRSHVRRIAWPPNPAKPAHHQHPRARHGTWGAGGRRPRHALSTRCRRGADPDDPGADRCRRAGRRPPRSTARPATTGSSSTSPMRTGRSSRSSAVDLRVTDAERSYHVPLLLAPFSMTTYRGS